MYHNIFSRIHSPIFNLQLSNLWVVFTINQTDVIYCSSEILTLTSVTVCACIAEFTVCCIQAVCSVVWLNAADVTLIGVGPYCVSVVSVLFSASERNVIFDELKP